MAEENGWATRMIRRRDAAEGRVPGETREVLGGDTRVGLGVGPIPQKSGMAGAIPLGAGACEVNSSAEA